MQSNAMFGVSRPVPRLSYTIAIVDDHRDTREWMRIYFEEEFFVSLHESARDLLDFVSTHHCDLILSDISLPDMDGYALLGKIRSNPGLSHLPVIAISARFNKAEFEKARRAGFDECFAKPVDMERLMDGIKRHLQLDNPERGR
jgi:CheY-like chemotaxis protein